MFRVVLLASLVACSSGGGDVSINVTHDVCAPITISSPTATAAELAGIDGAFALWRAHDVATLERADQGMIEIRFEPASGLFFGLYDDERSVIYINESITDPVKLPIVIAHELGHAFGLAHVSGRPSLMNPGNTGVQPTVEDDAEVQRLWGPCAP